MKKFLKPWDKTGIAALLAAFTTGLYVTVFYLTNNLTMFQLDAALVLFGILTALIVAPIAVTYHLLHVLGKGDQARAVVVFVIAVFLVSCLRPGLSGLAFGDGFFGILGGQRAFFANTLFVVIPAAMLSVVFKRDVQKLTIVLGAMTVAAIAMNFDNIKDSMTETVASKKPSPELRSVTLKEKPNIYFILVDGYSSFAYMREHSIDVSPLTNYLSSNGFRLYDDTYSNYQPTTVAMPAILDMEHHYYTLNENLVNFSEVTKQSRVIIGGENNVAHILKRNGYSIQYIHEKNYLLLAGCSADYCFPKNDSLAFIWMVLGKVSNKSLVQHSDAQTIRQRVMTLMDDSDNAPRFQYIHVFFPSHVKNKLLALGECNEDAEVKKYASRVAKTGIYLQSQIDDIIGRDPDAIVVIASDHGPLISRTCSFDSYINTVSEYRDRAGALMAIRWSKNYDGRYDDRIISGVNLFRYVLASLAEDEAPLVQTAVPDDVFIRAGEHRIFKIIDNGKPLDTPVAYTNN